MTVIVVVGENLGYPRALADAVTSFLQKWTNQIAQSRSHDHSISKRTLFNMWNTTRFIPPILLSPYSFVERPSENKTLFAVVLVVCLVYSRQCTFHRGPIFFGNLIRQHLVTVWPSLLCRKRFIEISAIQAHRDFNK